MVKIAAISDTHLEHAGWELEPGDVLVHAGDLTRRGTLEELELFDQFLGTLPYQHRVVICGNHDFCFERDPEAARARLTHAIYLQDSAVTVMGLKIYGSPWQPWFYDWAFNLPRGPALRAKWDLIPDDVDILLTHGPPLGHGDLTFDGRSVGCADLYEAISRTAPQLHVFGHIHEARGRSRHPDSGTELVNACICDLSYNPTGEPHYFEIAGCHQSIAGT